MRRIVCTTLTFVLVLSLRATAQSGDQPVPLFNGKDLAGWKLRGSEKRSKWAVGTASVDAKGGARLQEGWQRAGQ